MTNSAKPSVAVDPQQVMRRDLFPLRRAKRQDDAWHARRNASARLLALRREASLTLSYPTELPISAHAEAIKEQLVHNPVIVVAGETGSGKTTQLPKICLEAGFGRRAMIGHTQPRRLAARAVASRIAEELEVPLGETVGYAMRFTDRVGERTLVKLVTDGLLLTEIRRDKFLDAYDVIIVDEAHERSLNVDFLLGYLKTLTRRRQDLRIIITSATIDVAAFARHFDDAPVVEVGGRGYPVTTHYFDGAEDHTKDVSENRTKDASKDGELDSGDSIDERLLSCIQEIETNPDMGPHGAARDVLVFQSGEREILDTARMLRRQVGNRFEILPLYARLSSRDQQRIFRRGKMRRIVLATNVAETSLTVPNIGYVIDPGFARVSRYSFRSKLQRLPIEPISQASANQRQGRCGRVAPGHCFRLYAESDFLSRPEYTDPEIKRTNLAAVVLQMRAFGIGDPLKFPFLDPPDPAAVRDAQKLLDELQAFEADKLTDVGRTMARLPVDPRLGRVLVAANRERSLTEGLIIVSALAVQDPRERPPEKAGSADAAHERFFDERSDFLAYVNLWRWFEERREHMTRSAQRRLLERNYLSVSRMREWRDLHRQLLLAVKDLGFRLNEAPADYSSVHRSLLAGSLGLIGQHDEKGHYLGTRQLKFRIFPGSALAQRTPRWVMAAEITETRRVYARTVASVEAKWIEELAQHLVKRSHSEPHWNAKRGEAEAFESVTLYGLRLVERRRVSYTRIDPLVAREFLLRDGLVRGGVAQDFDFLTHNQKQIAAIVEEEAKGRRRDLLISEEAIVELYQARIPDDVASVAALARWWRKPGVSRDALFFSREQLLRGEGVSHSETEFPPELEQKGVRLSLSYRFAPGEPDDGVSVSVDVGTIESLLPEALEWSVPGFFSLVCEQWLRTLPKQKRRRLAPIPDRLPEILAVLLKRDRYRQGKLTTALSGVLQDLYQLPVDAGDWDRDRVDAHLLINVKVFDAAGKLLAQGRDAAALKRQFAMEMAARMDGGLRQRYEQADLQRFPDVDLNTSVLLDDDDGQVLGYPALEDQGQRVALKLMLTATEQSRANRNGFARLALLRVSQTARYLKKDVQKQRRLGLYYAALGDGAQLADELQRAAAWYCFFEGRKLPTCAAEFDQRVDELRGELAEKFQATVGLLERILEKRFELVRLLDETSSPAYADAVADIRSQLSDLVPADVLQRTPWANLQELPRYLDAARYRIEHLQGKVQRDRDHIELLTGLQQRLQRLKDEDVVSTEQWVKCRFLLEDLRVAVFAEGAGGKVRGAKVSVKRVTETFGELERALGVV